MRKYLRYNSMTALLLRIAEVVSGLILPRFILMYYGSETNGLVNSISQFLSVISFLDMGTTAVVTSSLYRPIADHNQNKIDQIVSAARNFFQKIAYVLIAYVVVLIIVYPWISDNTFDRMSTALLIMAMAIGSFAQYYTGVVDQIFLSANQREFIYSSACVLTIILNIIFSIILIRLGASIQVVRFSTSIIYLIRPAVLRVYIRRRYSLNRKTQFPKDAIPQRWSGIAQHVAFKILTCTDSIVLTIFSSLADVSIYAIYNMVTNGVYMLLAALTNGIKARLGNLWALERYEQVRQEYKWYEWLYHMGVAFVYSCMLSLLVPFIMTYTNGITDVNYNQSTFAVLITLAYAALTMGQFGIIIIHAVNHFKQTQIYYAISAIINVVVSVSLVIRYGLIGVSIGTLCAMLFQFAWAQWYMAKKLFHISLWGAVKQILTDFIAICLGYFLTRGITIESYTYFSWIIMAFKVVLINIPVILLLNFILYRKNMIDLCKNIIGRLRHRLGT